jgi:hypothetical protein
MPSSTQITLLRLFPVMSSLVSLMWAVDEYQFLSSWMNPTYRTKANSLLPAWFATWGKMGSLVLFTSFPLSLTTGIGNFFVNSKGLRSNGALKWYWLGVAFTASHLLVYGRTALGLLANIRNDEPKGNPTESMGKWLRMHAMRAFTSDVPAFISFTVAFLSVASVET